MKRLVVFCDGTWNAADRPAVTNVCKLREAVDESESAAVRQLVHYEPGVGTRMWDALTSSDSIQAAYEKLLNEYDVSADKLREDLSELVGKLVAKGLLEARDGRSNGEVPVP